GGLFMNERYQAVTAREAGIGFGLAVVFVLSLTPLIILGGGGGDTLSSIGLFGTLLLVSGYIYGLYKLSINWEKYKDNTGFIKLIGIAAISLFLLRYFILALIPAVKQSGIGGMIVNLLQNTLWLVDFTQLSSPNPRLEFGYDRFLLAYSVTLVGITYYLTEKLGKSPFGRVLKAIREDEDVASSLGKDTFTYKIQAMIYGSALAGLAGTIWAIFTLGLNYSMFRPRFTFIVFLMVVIGGTANNRGVILGAVIWFAFRKGTEDLATFFPTAARSSVQALRIAVIGALFIIVLYYRPEGIWGEKQYTAVTEGEE
ncbi:MAG: branched-chain amino acid ABC transporter permease, partial [Halobacteriaceae archaeon]